MDMKIYPYEKFNNNDRKRLRAIKFLFSSEFIFFIAVAIQLILTYLFISSGERNSYETPLAISLNSHSASLYSYSAACVATCAIGGILIIDNIFAVYIGTKSLCGSPYERMTLSTVSLTPLIPLTALALQFYSYIPYTFAFTNSLQLCGLNYKVLNILRRVFPHVLTNFRTQSLEILGYSVSITLVIGFGQDYNHWSIIISYLLMISYLLSFFYIVAQVITHYGFLKKKIADYSSDEVSSICYLFVYKLFILIQSIVYICFGFRYTEFNPYGINAAIYNVLFTTMCLYCIPGKIAKMKHVELLALLEAERQEFTEERHSATLTRVQQKQHTIKYISHEIRTPAGVCITSFSIVLDTLRKRKESRDQHIIELLQDGLSACNTTVSILNDMLMYESMEAGEFKVSPETVPVLQAVNTIVNNIKGIGQQKNIRLIVENQLNTIESSKLLVQFDVAKIEQVFLNIAANSVAFSQPNQVLQIVISKSHNHHNHHFNLLTPFHCSQNLNYMGVLTISFIDSGIGMLPGKLKRVLSEFDPDRLQGGGGMGLGLFISQNIVNSHHGTIDVTSNGIGNGTRVDLNFASYSFLETDKARKDEGKGMLFSNNVN